jgi:hypothetical protein
MLRRSRRDTRGWRTGNVNIVYTRCRDCGLTSRMYSVSIKRKIPSMNDLKSTRCQVGAPKHDRMQVAARTLCPSSLRTVSLGPSWRIPTRIIRSVSRRRMGKCVVRFLNEVLGIKNTKKSYFNFQNLVNSGGLLLCVGLYSPPQFLRPSCDFINLEFLFYLVDISLS